MEWWADWYGWSIGAIGTGSQIELDEKLDGIKLAICPVSNHKYLTGVYPEENANSLPMMHAERRSPRGVRFRWRMALSQILQPNAANAHVLGIPNGKRHVHPGRVEVRFDDLALRLGGHLIQFE